MRAAAASLLAILACLAFAADGSTGAGPSGGRPVRAAAASAAPGRAASATRDRAASATPDRGVRAYFPGTDTSYEIDRGHLVVWRTGLPRWRSTGLFPSQFRLGLVAAGRQGVAFSYHGWLYIARRDGAERRVARDEGAVGWTTHGVYTYGGRGNLVRLRTADGRPIRTVARRPQQHTYDPATGALDLVADGELIVADGARVHRVTSLRARGLRPRATELIPLGGLIELMSADRIVILRPDGSRYASTPLPNAGTVSSGLTVASGRTAVAFTIAYGLSDDPNTTRRAHGTEIIYLLAAGARKAVAIHTVHVTFKPCERGADVSWHGRWLLYRNSEGNVARVDATGTST